MNGAQKPPLPAPRLSSKGSAIKAAFAEIRERIGEVRYLEEMRTAGIRWVSVTCSNCARWTVSRLFMIGCGPSPSRRQKERRNPMAAFQVVPICGGALAPSPIPTGVVAPGPSPAGPLRYRGAVDRDG